MSAYVVDPAHIDVLLSVAIHGPAGVPRGRWTAPYTYELFGSQGPTGPLHRADADLAGRLLLAECIASVSHRYPGDAPLPGPMPTPDPEQYEWTDFGRLLAPVEACCAIDGYEYQSCEHPGWQGSGAFYFCHRFRCALIGVMPGYDGAEWHWTAEAALARAYRDDTGGGIR